MGVIYHLIPRATGALDKVLDLFLEDFWDKEEFGQLGTTTVMPAIDILEHGPNGPEIDVSGMANADNTK